MGCSDGTPRSPGGRCPCGLGAHQGGDTATGFWVGKCLSRGARGLLPAPPLHPPGGCPEPPPPEPTGALGTCQEELPAPLKKLSSHHHSELGPVTPPALPIAKPYPPLSEPGPQQQLREASGQQQVQLSLILQPPASLAASSKAAVPSPAGRSTWRGRRLPWSYLYHEGVGVVSLSLLSFFSSTQALSVGAQIQAWLALLQIRCGSSGCRVPISAVTALHRGQRASSAPWQRQGRSSSCAQLPLQSLTALRRCSRNASQLKKCHMNARCEYLKFFAAQKESPVQIVEQLRPDPATSRGCSGLVVRPPAAETCASMSPL
ncbi:hypothetical protein Anapl_08563 [Anas platyrhynchos]|uniref:Uncharacterized protein n=1 Tax=Anas platyrhynchos TaxID=8839 RepID=R0KFI2_ANAPL|nr:hypothetical protein Anapl_08563 [Anas platyrhynchos]